MINNPTSAHILGQDLDFSSIAVFSPIPVDEGFTFDGKNFTISNWNLAGVVSTGIFTGALVAGTGLAVSITNLNLSSITLSGSGLSGILLAQLIMPGSAADVTISNINISNSSILGTTQSVGGLIGQTSISGTGTVAISNITVSNTTVQANSGNTGSVIGNIAAIASGRTVQISSVTVTGGTVTSPGISDFAGGVIGRISGNSGTLTMSSLASTATVNGDQNVGGLIGSLTFGIAGIGTLSNSNATGNVTATTNFAGGLIGLATTAAFANRFIISNSYYITGTVSAGADSANGVGGLVGNANRITIQTSFSNGIVNSTTGASPSAGGLIGYVTSSVISDCYSLATINGTGAGNSGGIAGLMFGNSVDKVYAGGAITAAPGGNNALFGSSSVNAKNSFFDNSGSGTTQAASGDATATGVNHATIALPATFTGAGWSLPGTWVMPSGACTNFGFPGPALAGVTPGC